MHTVSMSLCAECPNTTEITYFDHWNLVVGMRICWISDVRIVVANHDVPVVHVEINNASIRWARHAANTILRYQLLSGGYFLCFRIKSLIPLTRIRQSNTAAKEAVEYSPKV